MIESGKQQDRTRFFQPNPDEMDPVNYLPKKKFDANHGSGDILGIDSWGRPIIDLSKQRPRDPEDWIAHEQP